MKRAITISGLLLAIAFNLQAQSEVDGLRFSQNYLSGTARSMSMGGAFGALGGDFTCLAINPAGLAVYRHSEFTFTPSISYNKSLANYYGYDAADSKTKLNFNNLGLIGAVNSGSETGWVSVNFGLGYNRLNNFHNRYSIEGTNNSNSMIDYFIEKANGKSYSKFNDYSEGMAWNTYLFDPDPYSASGNEYVSVLVDYDKDTIGTYGQTQRKNIETRGSIGEYDFSLAGNWENKLYVGVTLGIQSLNYEEDFLYTEINLNDSTISYFKSFEYEKEMRTKGTGFNVKIGSLYRPLDWLRVGVALHTPTFYDLSYDYSTSMTSDNYSRDTYNDTTYSFEPIPGKYDYTVTTPFKAVGSIAFIYEKMALFSLDCEYIDYSTIQMASKDAGSFNDANNSMRKNYISTFNIRAGAEYRYDPFSVRLGYTYFGSPYHSSTPNADAYKSAISGGVGIKNENVYFDFAYVLTMGNEKYYLYDGGDKIVEPATISNMDSKIVATFGVKF